MSKLVWDQQSDRRFEAGLDRGVLYLQDGHGVAWNGLISVVERNAREITPIYFDGIKVNEYVASNELSATLKAYTYPDEFSIFDGVEELDDTGLFLYNQPASRFHLSYRTFIGDQSTTSLGYKLHLWYNLTAVPSQVDRATLGETLTPAVFEWTLSAIPALAGHRVPTPHVVLNSLKCDPKVLEAVENTLYGTETNDPSIPELSSLVAYLSSRTPA